MDVNKLMYALDDENNESIMNLTSQKIMEMNLNILNELHLEKQITLNYLKKLKEYKYVDELNDLKYGAFIRWIPITDPNYLPLYNCGIICDIKITDIGVIIIAKNFMHRHYSFKMDECLIFQKLNNQELIILKALDHLENKLDEEVEDEEEDDN
uniref:Uncharacterized protein n=1 Tax=viral metagenome TaxID=1070528 RepID=A0A6C0KQE4_9ZZZZ